MKKLVSLMFAIGLLFGATAYGDSYDQQIKAISDSVITAIDAAGKKKIAVVDFADLKGNVSELGRFVAEELSVNIVMGKKGFTVVDRANLKLLMKEHQLTLDGLVDPANAKKLGQVAGVDALVIGTFSDMQDDVNIYVKIEATDTAEVVGAAKGRITKTKEIRDLAGSVQPPQPPKPIIDGVGAGPKPVPAVTEAKADPAGYKPGALLDVWLRPNSFAGGVPNEPSLVSMVDNSGAFFNMGRYADEKEMESNVGKPILQVWKCYLKIQKPGTHVIIGEFRKSGQEVFGNNVTWHVQFTFDNEQLLDEKITFRGYAGDEDKFTQSRPFTKELKPGYYEVRLVAWMPDQTRLWNYKPLSFALRLREPGTSKPREVGSGDIFYKEQ